MISKKTTKFFTFSQNNSGGHFIEDVKLGIGHHVIIEAISQNDAIERAKNIGLYFDGCENEIDCECCGDRWYMPLDESSTEPLIYGQNAKNYIPTYVPFADGGKAFIHYLNNTIETIDLIKHYENRKVLKQFDKQKNKT